MLQTTKPFLLLILILCFYIPISAQVENATFYFIENKGQWDAEILFETQIEGGKMYLTKTGIQYQFLEHVDRHHKKYQPKTAGLSIVDVDFLGANKASKVTYQNPSTAVYNYYLGSDTTKWANGCRAFATVTYHDIYPNIDLKFYSNGQNLKYDLIVKPGGNPAFIKFKYTGYTRISLTNGAIVAETPFNTIIEDTPVAFYEGSRLKSQINCRYQLQNDELTFLFPEGYDATETLVIDPELIFSTFSASVSDNFGYTACFDNAGNLYSGGIVFGPVFPSTGGQGFGGGSDMAILKYSPDGRNLLYGTFIGGTSGDTPHSMVVNNRNELLIMGTTGSNNYPTSAQAFDRSYNGGRPFSIFDQFNQGTDIVVTKLGPSGNLISSTFMGGPGNDGILRMRSIADYISPLVDNYGDYQRGDIFVDANDNVFVASSTDSTGFPVKNAFQPNYAGGSSDAVIFSLNSNLSELRWSTYLGGGNSDAAYSVKVDKNGSVIVGGGSTSNDFPTTAGTIKGSFGGQTDGFISKLSNDGQSLLASTYLGTTRKDQVYFVDVDTEGNVYALGQTRGSYPVTAGAYANVSSGQFIHKLNAELNRTVFSTVFGSGTNEPNISPTAFLVNSCNNIFLSGWGGIINNDLSINSGNTLGMPVTKDALYPTTDGDDFYLMALSADGSKLLYATFFGSTNNSGDHVDGGTSRFDKRGVIYQSVCTCGGRADNFPTTPGVWSRINQGVNSQGVQRCNNAAFKFDLATLEARFQTNSIQGNRPNIQSGCAPLTVQFTNTSRGGETNLWTMADGTIYENRDTVIHTFQNPGNYNVGLQIVDERTCQIRDVAFKTIQVFDDQISLAPEWTICEGQSVQLQASGGRSYIWQDNPSLSNTNTPNPIASPTVNTTYKVTITTPNGCIKEATTTVKVKPILKANFETYDTNGQNEGVLSGCAPLAIRFKNSSENEVDQLWEFEGNGTSQANDTTTKVFAIPGNYNVTLTVTNPATCTVDEKITKTITVFGSNLSVVSNGEICAGEGYQLGAGGGIAYSWSPSIGLNSNNIANPLASPTVTTTYTVTITTANNCVVDSTVLVTVIPNIEEFFTIDQKLNCTAPTEYTFNFAVSNGGAKSILQLGDGTTANVSPYTYSYAQPGRYRVSLVTDASCVIDFEQEVEALPFEIANAFSPNGDGINDFFEVPVAGASLAVFTRTGQKVYENTNYQNEWGAKDLPSGTYYYTVKYADGETCNGWVQVVR
uniref:DUF7948 domain-containing protein n=1 Tax=Fulvivirga sp. TaxID=1931237 RepID=UPI00404A7E06